MSYLIVNLDSIRPDCRVDPMAAWRPRHADANDDLPDPRATRHAEANVARGRDLDAAKRARWDDAQRPRRSDYAACYSGDST